MPELDLEALRIRLAALGVSDVHALAGGASSLTYSGMLDGRRVVVKVAPPGHEPVGHRDVLRQAGIIKALAGTDVPVPEVLSTDAGAPPLFVTSYVDGESFEPLFDGGAAPDHVVTERYRNAARAMATLHRVSTKAVGVESESVVDAGAEVERWCATLRTVDPALVPGWEHVRDALQATAPAPRDPSVVHGDFRLGNLLARGEEIVAVIDWEIWSVGDPRIDLGWFLVNADPDTYSRPSTYVDAVPPRSDLLSCYGGASEIEWFMALACFKSAATWGLIVKHNRRRSTPQPELEAMAPVLPSLLERARTLL